MSHRSESVFTTRQPANEFLTGWKLRHIRQTPAFGKIKLRFARTVTVSMFCKKSKVWKIFQTARGMLNFGAIIRLTNHTSLKFPTLNKDFSRFNLRSNFPSKVSTNGKIFPLHHRTNLSKAFRFIPLRRAKFPAECPWFALNFGKSAEFSASFAVLEARFNGILIARGIADRDGQIVLIFPSLAPQSNPIVSPPATSTRILLAEQSWNLDLTVKYQPNIFQTSPNLIESEEENLPDLRLVLAQAEGTLWADGGQTEEYTTAVLQTGRELILRSRQSANTSPMPDSETALSSFLFVSPAI